MTLSSHNFSPKCSVVCVVCMCVCTCVYVRMCVRVCQKCNDVWKNKGTDRLEIHTTRGGAII